MKLLLTGQSNNLTSSFINELAKTHQVILCASSTIDCNDKVKQVHHPIKSDGFEHLFRADTLKSVVFNVDSYSSLCHDFTVVEQLEHVLLLCVRYQVRQVFVLSSSYVFQQTESINEYSIFGIQDVTQVMLSAIHKLCDTYRINNGLSITMVCTPYIIDGVDTILDKIMNNVTFNKNSSIDVLFSTDLAKFMVLLLNNVPLNDSLLVVPGGIVLSLETLINFLSDISSKKITSSVDNFIHTIPITNNTRVQNEYRFNVVYEETDVYQLIEKQFLKKNDEIKPKKSFEIKAFWMMIIEVLLFYFIAEFINYRISYQVDIRLLYIVLMSNTHGLYGAVLSFILSSVSLLNQVVTSGISYTSLLSDISYWTPWILYISLALLLGSAKEKTDKQIQLTEAENLEMRDKTAMFKELYEIALIDKAQYKKQLMIYRDSYSKIFDFTQKIDHALPDEIWKATIIALEEVLESQSISIYSINEGKQWSRLLISSKKIAQRLKKSRLLSEFELAMADFIDGKVWCNSKRLVGYPDYIFPVYNDNVIVLLILIEDVRFDQMSTYYHNLINIFCNLFKDSLRRSMKMMHLPCTKMLVPTTDILSKETFVQYLKAKKEMKEEGLSDYVMVSIYTNDIVACWNNVKMYFRAVDVFGEIDGGLGVSLIACDEKAGKEVIKRIQQEGYECDIV